MMLRNRFFVSLILLTLTVAVGCQGNGDPISPGDNGITSPAGDSSITERYQGFTGDGHNLLYMVEVFVDFSNESLELTPLRTSTQHLNLIQLIPIYCQPASECLDFINLDIDETTAICELDVVVTHPIPDPFANCFDMRGIGIFKGTVDPGFSGGPVAGQILNADGWTSAYDSEGQFDAFINPFVAFNTDMEHRVFEQSTTTQEHITCQFPSIMPDDTKFLYALDASWSDPNSVDPGDPSTSQNVAEPYQVNLAYTGPISDEIDSEATLIVEAFDWQENAGDATVECPDLVGIGLPMTNYFADDGRYVWYLNMINDEVPGVGEFPFLVEVDDEFATQQDLVNPTITIDLISYQLGYIDVYDHTTNTAPVASVVADDLVVEQGGVVSFDATGSSDFEDGSISTYYWDVDGDLDFDDGFVGTKVYQYFEVGDFMVNCIVEDTGGLTDVLDEPIIIHVTATSNTPPVASAFTNNATPNITQEITLDASDSTDLEDGTPVSYEWDLDGDGTYGDKTGDVITHSWATAGTYMVDVLVKDSGGLGDTLDTKLEIEVIDSGNEPPVASAISDTNDAEVGDLIGFDASASNDPDGDIVQYQWDFDGDGDYSDGYGELIQHQYWAPSTYLVDLKVVDDGGLSDTLDTPITINITGDPNLPPVAFAEASKYLLNVDEAVTFDATGSTDPEEGTPVEFFWDLNGDENYVDAFVDTVPWSYHEPGEYLVDVKVCDSAGLCDTLDTKLTIQVLEGTNTPPEAVAFADQTVVYLNDTVYFDGSESVDAEDGAPVSWEWDLDEDGEYDDSPFILASKEFTSLGEFDIDLKVTDSEGLWDTLDTPITITVLDPSVNAPPTADADVSCTLPYVGQQVFFTDTSFDLNGSVVKWEWDFQDGNGWIDYTSTEGDAVFVWDDEGVYNVDLRVTDDQDETDQLDEPITVLVEFNDYTPPTDPPECDDVNTHTVMVSQPLSPSNQNAEGRDIASLPNGNLAMVLNNDLVHIALPSTVMQPALIEGAGDIRSIDCTSTGILAVSPLTDGIITLYNVISEGPENSLLPNNIIDTGLVLSAVTFDDQDNLWAYGEGQIMHYFYPDYTRNPCKSFPVPEIPAMGTVDEMAYSMWNRSVLLAVNDGANGTIVEVGHQGDIGTILNNVLAGPSRYMDIIADVDVTDPDTSGCRIEVFGGMNEGYITRLNANLEPIAQMTYGFWGFRAATLDFTANNRVMAIEDCCVSWLDLMQPPIDWKDQ